MNFCLADHHALSQSVGLMLLSTCARDVDRKPCARFSLGKVDNTSSNGFIHCTRRKTLVDNVKRYQVQIRNFSNFSNFRWTSWNKQKHQPENVWELWIRKSFFGLGGHKLPTSADNVLSTGHSITYIKRRWMPDCNARFWLICPRQWKVSIG